MVHSPDFFPKSSQTIFVKGEAFLYGSCWVVGRWYGQLAAIWHWYLPLIIMHKFILIFNFFILCLSIPFFIFFFNLVSINLMEWSVIPACPSLMCSFNRGIIEGTNSLKICLMFVYVSLYALCLLLWLVLQTDLREGWYIIMWEEFRNVYLLITWVWLSWSDPVWLTGH